MWLLVVADNSTDDKRAQFGIKLLQRVGAIHLARLADCAGVLAVQHATDDDRSKLGVLFRFALCGAPA